MIMSKIKLMKVDELSNGTQRFQSQLYVGKDTADFVMRNDGIMRCYGNGKNSFDYYEYKEPYEIVSSKNDMVRQAL
jgi:hypothetical protein